MSLQGAEETPLCGVFPQNNAELFRVLQYEFIVGLRCERCIQESLKIEENNVN